jgi:hypothetical protein
MIALVAASAIFLVATQAAIEAPTKAFRACLKQAGDKAKSEKVAAAGIEAYIRNACVTQGDALKTTIVNFRVKNGMARKSAADDAEMTVDDYVATIVDNYAFMADFNKPQQAVTPAAPATPASAPQPPK